MNEKSLELFMAKVHMEPNCGCWLWTACINNTGYGVVTIGNKQQLAHRAAYTHFVGEIPAGLDLDHLCRVPACCNPRHLEPVSRAENSKRGLNGSTKTNQSAQRMLAKTHCRKGHPYSGDNLYIQKSGKRQCKQCKRDTLRAWQKARRAA